MKTSISFAALAAFSQAQAAQACTSMEGIVKCLLMEQGPERVSCFKEVSQQNEDCARMNSSNTANCLKQANDFFENCMSDGIGLSTQQKSHCLKRYKAIKSDCKSKPQKYVPKTKVRTIKEKQMKYKVSTTRSTWQQAQNNCFKEGGYQLAKISTKAENKKLKEALLQADPKHENKYWIGLNDSEQEGKFVWVDGSKPTFTNWNEGQPNDGKMFTEDCVNTEKQKDRSWDDSSCRWPK